MSDCEHGSQPYCRNHGFTYHQCCSVCRREHGREVDAGKFCMACRGGGDRKDEMGLDQQAIQSSGEWRR